MAAEPGRPGFDDAPGPRSQGGSQGDPKSSQADPGGPAGGDASARPAGDGGRAPAGKNAARRKRPFWRDLVAIVVAALILTILLKAFVVQVFSIPSASMENTLRPGDRVLVSKIVYRFRGIARRHRGVQRAGILGAGRAAPAGQPAGPAVGRPARPPRRLRTGNRLHKARDRPARRP